MTAGPTGQFWLLVSAPRFKKGYFAIFLIVEEAPYSQPLSVSLFQCLCYLGNITFWQQTYFWLPSWGEMKDNIFEF